MITLNQGLALLDCFLFIAYMAIELAFGGGKPGHKDHNRSDRYGGGWFT